MVLFSLSLRRHALFTTCLVPLALAPAAAQEATDLEVLTVEDQSVSADQETGGPKGETIVRQATIGKGDRVIAETPRSVSVVSEQRLSDQGVDDISDALFYVPGVYSETFGPDTRVDSKYIRGVSAPHFLDGLPHNFGFYNNSRIDPYALTSVEVIKGPVGALYGGGALGGLVNLTSKMPQAETHREAFVEIGTDQRKRTGIDVTGALDQNGTWLYRFTGAVQDAGTQIDTVDDNGFFVMPSLTWQPTDDTKLTVLGYYQKDDGEPTSRFIPIEGSLLPTDNGNFVGYDTFVGERGFDTYDTEKASITALFEHRFNDVFSVDVAARYSDSNVEYDQIYPYPWNVTGDSVPRLLYSSRAYLDYFVSDARVNADFDTGALTHNAAVGLDYQNATTRNDSISIPNFDVFDLINPVYGTPIPDFERVAGTDQKTDQTGIYAYDRISFDDRLFVSLGLRHDWYNDAADTKTTAWSGNAGALYRFDNGIAPYVSYATGFTPVAADTSGFTYDPVEGRQIEAGVKYQPPGTPHLFTAAVFDILQTNRLQPNPNGGPGLPDSVQTGETTIRGIELEAQTRVNDFELLAGYTYLDTEDETTGFQLASVPSHQASAWLTWRPQGQLEGWVFGGGVRYVGDSLDGADNFETPSYVLADALVGYETETWSAQLNVQNITDEDYLTTCLARGDCFYGQGRTVNFRLATRF
ncbi:TonB-dependent siderophore receptor [Pararhizobium haloflavum]|uniref:TonB-dependent siderophore receptor n=1 Tax=Pararhizobium haloflavum TaxID=2037914 RepID=UPI000C1887E3|nr:TonB-dependent siderophore receptor [Pararhizobium haloflavum]